MDIVSGELRTTFLTYGKTGETFLYRPYTCKQIDADHKYLELMKQLFLGYPIGTPGNSQLVYGVGPLWLQANSIKSNVTKSEAGDGNRAQSYLRDLRQYKIDLTGKSFQLRFYFLPRLYQFVDTIEWAEVQSGEQIVRANAKVTFTGMSPDEDHVFKLPAGYGCRRKDESDKPLISTGLVVLHDGIPNQANFVITASTPVDDKGHDWISHRYSVDVLKGASALGTKGHPRKPLFVTLTQEKDAETSKIKRTKKVWWAPGEMSSYNIYNIDENSDHCTIESSNSIPHIDLHFLQGDNLSPSDEITLELLSRWLSDTSSFHLLDPGTNQRGWYKDLILERRYDNISLIDGAEAVSISVVKRLSAYSQYLQPEEEEEEKNPNLIDDYQSSMTIFFYTPLFDKLLKKVVIALNSDHDIDYDYLIDMVDVRPCFDSKSQKTLIIDYPVESLEVFEVLQENKKMVKFQLHLDVLSYQVPILPIQLSEIETDLNLFSMRVKLSMIDVPLTQTYEHKVGFGLQTQQEYSSKFLNISAPNADKCASHCAYYDCYIFAYNTQRRICSLGLDEKTMGMIKLASSDDTVFRFVKDSRFQFKKELPHHLSPDVIRELINAIISGYDRNQVTGSEPLILKFHKTVNAVLPNTASSDRWHFVIPQNVRTAVDLSEGDSDESIESGQESEGKKLEGTIGMSYCVLYEGREFTDSTDSITGLTYEECLESSRDLDHRSFSYCSRSGRCRTTKLHQQNMILEDSRPEVQCDIYTLEYLSMFEKYDDVAAPAKFRHEVKGVKPRDCANLCFEGESFLCQGFYYCSGLPDDARDRCFMTDAHIEDPAFVHNPAVHLSEHEYDCDFYSRSYLSQYDIYYGKAI